MSIDGYSIDTVVNFICDGVTSTGEITAQFDSPQNYDNAIVTLLGGRARVSEYSITGEQKVLVNINTSTVITDPVEVRETTELDVLFGAINELINRR
jgi:hypothetical protein